MFRGPAVAAETLDDARGDVGRRGIDQDRKSTRLNSSHSQISYAVFCLKKKKTDDSDSRSGIVKLSAKSLAESAECPHVRTSLILIPMLDLYLVYSADFVIPIDHSRPSI